MGSIHDGRGVPISLMYRSIEHPVRTMINVVYLSLFRFVVAEFYPCGMPYPAALVGTQHSTTLQFGNFPTQQ